MSRKWTLSTSLVPGAFARADSSMLAAVRWWLREAKAAWPRHTVGRKKEGVEWCVEWGKHAALVVGSEVQHSWKY